MMMDYNKKYNETLTIVMVVLRNSNTKKWEYEHTMYTILRPLA